MSSVLLLEGLILLAVGVGLGYYIRQLLMQSRKSSIEARLKKLVEDSKTEAKEVMLDAKEKAAKILDEAKGEEKDRLVQVRKLEERLLEREGSVDRRVQQFEKKEKDLVVGIDSAIPQIKEVEEKFEEITGTKDLGEWK